jgi:hypothetical protein
MSFSVLPLVLFRASFHYVTEQPSTSKTEGAAIQKRKGVPPFLGCFGLLALPTTKARILCLD